MSRYDKRDAEEQKLPFAFQQKVAMRYLKTRYAGRELYSALIVYLAITWIASDFSRDDPKHQVRNWPKTIASYCGIGRGTASKFIQAFATMGLIQYERRRNHGRFDIREVVLPATLPTEVVEATVRLAVDGEELTL